MPEVNMSKQFSGYPFMDILIYYVKIMAMGAIVKSQKDADANETPNTLFYSDLYLSSIEGTGDFMMYDYSRRVLHNVGVPANLIPTAMVDCMAIPKDLREACRNLQAKEFVKAYEEKNEYYRRILGLPPIGEQGIYLTEEDIDFAIDIDLKIPLHEQPARIIKDLKKFGVFQKVTAPYTNSQKHQYLKFIGENVNLYRARKSYDFQLLYIPTIPFPSLMDKFKKRYEVNRVFVMNTIYSEAYRFDSPYYDNFITIFIIIQTMIDLLSEVQEHIIKLDVLDEHCIRAIFEAHGVPYFNIIPLKYQIAMVKNLNTLLKYKSTAKCMIDICSLFGFDDIRVFKYYMLKDRAYNEQTGEYPFYYKKTKYLDTTDKLEVVNSSKHIEDGKNIYDIPFPIDNFLEKGNIFDVIVDGILINPDDYEVTDDGKIEFTNPSTLKGKKNINFNFYYNPSIKKVTDKNKYSIHTEVSYASIKSADQLEFIVPFPIENYLEKGFGLYVTAGSLFIDPTRYTIEGNKLTFKESYDWYDNGTRDIGFIFIYSDKYELHCKTDIITLDSEESYLKIPEPHKNYINYGKDFILSVGGTYIDKDRYFVHNDIVSFYDAKDLLSPDRHNVFNFIYGDSIEVELESKEIHHTVKAPGVQEYDIEFPFDGYLDDDNIVEVYLNEYPLNESVYDVYGDKLFIKNQNLVTRVGTKIDIKLIYAKNRAIKHTSAKIPINTANRNSIKLPFPYDDFIKLGNRCLVYRNGKIIDSDKYTITDDILTMNDPVDRFNLSDDIEFHCYNAEANKYSIKISEFEIIAKEDGQKVFHFELPFFNYVKSGNGLFFIINSTLITPNRYTIKNKKLILNDDAGFEIAKGDRILAVFVYNSIFLVGGTYIRKDIINAPVDRSNITIPIPFPFDNYLDSDNNNQLNILGADGTVLDSSVYEIFGNEVILYNIDEVLKHGDYISFEFIYINARVKSRIEEDIEKNYDLKFIKVPLTDSIDKHIHNRDEFLDYYSVTSDDWLWTNEIPNDEIKRRILEKEFNYTRTKYISIDSIQSMTKMTFEIPYFYNMLFDDIKLEERLKLRVPILDQDKLFRLNDIFCFLFSITYEYYGLADDIMQTPEQIMYIKGFNIDADLDILRKDLKRRGLSLEFTGGEKFKQYKTNLNNIKEYLDIFENNKQLRMHLLKGMFNANNKHEYDAFKDVYEATMQIEYNTKFFEIATGAEDTTANYTNFLKYRDKVLYNAILNIRSIDNNEQKRKEITELTISIIDSIELYLESDDYRHLFSKFPGVGADFIKIYVEKVINFFKSYKIELESLNTVYLFDNKYEQFIKPIDDAIITVKNTIDDFVDIPDVLEELFVSLGLSEKLTTLEKIYIYRYWFKKIHAYDELKAIDKISMIVYLRLEETMGEDIDGGPDFIAGIDHINNIYDEIVSDIGDLAIMSINNTIKDRIDTIEKIYIRRHINGKYV